MKNSIDWHMQCLKNSESSLEQKKRELARIVASLNQDTDRVVKYKQQIERAMREGKDGFDSDKFGKSRVNTYINPPPNNENKAT